MARNNLVRALIGVVLAKAAVVGSWYLYQQAVQEDEENKNRSRNRNVEGSASGGTKLEDKVADEKPVPAKKAVKKAARPAKKAVKKVAAETPAKKAVKKAPRKIAVKKVANTTE